MQAEARFAVWIDGLSVIVAQQGDATSLDGDPRLTIGVGQAHGLRPGEVPAHGPRQPDLSSRTLERQFQEAAAPGRASPTEGGADVHPEG